MDAHSDIFIETKQGVEIGALAYLKEGSDTPAWGTELWFATTPRFYWTGPSQRLDISSAAMTADPNLYEQPEELSMTR